MPTMFPASGEWSGRGGTCKSCLQVGGKKETPRYRQEPIAGASGRRCYLRGCEDRPWCAEAWPVRFISDRIFRPGLSNLALIKDSNLAPPAVCAGALPVELLRLAMFDKNSIPRGRNPVNHPSTKPDSTASSGYIPCRNQHHL